MAYAAVGDLARSSCSGPCWWVNERMRPLSVARQRPRPGSPCSGPSACRSARPGADPPGINGQSIATAPQQQRGTGMPPAILDTPANQAARRSGADVLSLLPLANSVQARRTVHTLRRQPSSGAGWMILHADGQPLPTTPAARSRRAGSSRHAVARQGRPLAGGTAPATPWPGTAPIHPAATLWTLIYRVRGRAPGDNCHRLSDLLSNAGARDAGSAVVSIAGVR